MKIYNNPPRDQWQGLVTRPQIPLDFLDSAVRNMLQRVKKSGDEAIRELTFQYDKVRIDSFEVSRDEFVKASNALSQELKNSIRIASANIEKFHRAQLNVPGVIETTPGVICWRKANPIRSVGLYIPGGSAPLFSSVLMLAIPARLAGCKEIVLCTPPDKNGDINPAILFAAELTGVTRVLKIGGAQAIGAMAYGTKTIPAVEKIFGPGNQYVTKAKQVVAEEGVAIDMPAGPSEVMILADETCDPQFVAADLLSQAEHGEDSQVMLILNSDSMLGSILNEIDQQLPGFPRAQVAKGALLNSRVIILNDLDTAVDFVNEYAPEHLIINAQDEDKLAEKIENAGSVFIGKYTPEALGDYASGTNHTLPTNGFARTYSGISCDSFLKYTTFQKASAFGIREIGSTVEQMAEAEGLFAHKNAVTVRLKKINE